MRLKAAAPARFLPFGDSAVLVDFGNAISLEVNRRVMTLSRVISQADVKGVEELVPTYRSLLVRYSASETSYEQLVFRIRDIEETLNDSETKETGKIVTIPVIYGGEYGPDLGHVAKCHGLTEDQVVQIHASRTYRVYMLGFVAGFPYMGEVADEIATPRLETPRLKVHVGSVGIAEKQTGIYPCEAPGGWQIIGRTPLRLFDLLKQPPALVGPGDSVRFRQVRGEERSRIGKAIRKSAGCSGGDREGN